jgi:hypothetical protein
VQFDVLTVAILKNTVVWAVTPCKLVEEQAARENECVPEDGSQRFVRKFAVDLPYYTNAHAEIYLIICRI